MMTTTAATTAGSSSTNAAAATTASSNPTTSAGQRHRSSSTSSASTPAATALVNMMASSTMVQPPPPPPTLAILEGLSKRPEVMATLVDEALDQFRAQQRIVQFCTRQYRQRPPKMEEPSPPPTTITTTTTDESASSTQQQQQQRRSKRRKTEGDKSVATTTPALPSSVVGESVVATAGTTATATKRPVNNQNKHTTLIGTVNKWEHWLWRAMRSSSWSELQLACRLVLQHVLQQQQGSTSTASTATTPASSTAITSSSSLPSQYQAHGRLWDLRDALVHLLQRHVMEDPHLHPTWSSRQVNSQRRQRQDVAFVWMSMLKHVILTATAAEHDHVGILAFGASGGLTWMCRGIFRLALQLQAWTLQWLPWSGTAAVSDQRRNIVHRLMLMVDLCFNVVLHGSLMVQHSSNTSSGGTSTNTATGTTTTTSNNASSERSSKKNKESAKATTAAAAASGAADATATTANTTTTGATTSTTTTTGATSSSKSRRNKEESPSSSASISELKHKRIHALHKMHQLLWKASTVSSSSSSQQHPQPQSVETTLSPLACLLCAYHILTGDGLMAATSKISPHWTHCIATLGQLVDPNASVKVAVSTVRSASATAAATATTSEDSSKPATTTTTTNAATTTTTTSSITLPNSFSFGTATSLRVTTTNSATSAIAAALANHQADQDEAAAVAAAAAANESKQADDEDHDVVMLDTDHPVDVDDDDDDEGGEDDDDDDDDDVDDDGSALVMGGMPVGIAALDDHHHVVVMQRVHGEDDEENDDDDDDDDGDDAGDGDDDEDNEEVEGELGGTTTHHHHHHHHHDDDTTRDEDDDDDDDDDSDDNFLDGDDSDDGGCEHEDDHDIVIQEDDVARQLEEGLMELNDGEAMEVDLDELEASATLQSASAAAAALDAATAASSSSPSHANHHPSGSGDGGNTTTTTTTALDNKATSKDRKHALIRAGMQVLAAQHVHLHASNNNIPSAPGMQQKPSVPPASPLASLTSGSYEIPKTGKQQPLLSFPAEASLVTAMLHIVKPPKKPLNLRIFLRRAPTQEEFFRGSLSKNPISLSTLGGASASHANRGSNAASRGSQEPTVRDLRQYIANDLQMSDSAELLELLVANKILDPNLKLRVVHQVLWRNHLMENTSATLSSILAGSSSSFLASSGISAVFGSTLERAGSASSARSITAETPTSALPPMMVTYRLAGVDGEATEDTVSELVDPEAPLTTASAAEVEAIMEREYGITRLITDGRGVYVLLRSIENHLSDTLRRIRRDDVMRTINNSSHNPSRTKFRQSPPYAGLSLLRCCSKLSSNRKKLLQARAPTILLRLLLDVLNALDEFASAMGETEQHERFGSNPTAEVLQELIEVLASDISTVPTTAPDSSVVVDGYESDSNKQDASTLPMLLSSLESIFLSPGLRKVIAKLLPFLTYGQVSLSRELALKFKNHVFVDSLGEFECGDKLSSKSSMLMDTFVQSSIDLPTNEVCNTLRSELVKCGYVEMIANFILKDIPLQPPPWSPPLWGKDESPEKSSARRKRGSAGRREQLEDSWREYFERVGLRTAFSMIIGLCKNHAPTQLFVARFREDGKNVSLLLACHWMEATSDNSSLRIMMNGLGLLAETLLDEIKAGTGDVGAKVDAVRRKTRERKKEIAEERRNKTLAAMNSFGNVSADAGDNSEAAGRAASSVRETAASFLAPVLSFFRDSSAAAAAGATDAGSTPRNQPSQSKRGKKSKGSERNSPTKPAWMLEMEGMEDEKGLTCAVCQEGRTLQPSELLGLYAYVKKVSIPSNACGARNLIDGTALLTSLPLTLPDSLVGTHAAVEWFQVGKATGDDLRDDSSSSSSSQSALKRMVYYTTTVSAGNSIHFSCHSKARQADRSHPKAPKSEWEGASLRNSRVNCNVILPLVSSRSSKVPLVAVDSALTDYQTAISNLIGARPKSMLWTVLHDMRFLLLRMAYGETLNADCGGGSLASNAQLLFYQMLMADMFEKDAQVDAPETAQHARNLSAGYLAACAICRADDLEKGDFMSSTLRRHVADAAPMAALTCIMFHNSRDDYSDAKEADDITAPHPKRRWVIGREDFLAGLLNCAGRRHALGMEDSGCLGSRNRASRATSFADWELLSCDDDLDTPATSASRKKPALSGKKRSHMPAIDDFGPVLRPMITLFAILDTLSNEFVLNILDDERIADSANRIVEVIESCQRCKSIHELLVLAKVTMDHDTIMEELQNGMVSA